MHHNSLAHVLNAMSSRLQLHRVAHHGSLHNGTGKLGQRRRSPRLSSLSILCIIHSLLLSVSQEAASNGAKLVVLPEMWNCPYSNDSFPTYAGKKTPATPSSCPSAAVASAAISGARHGSCTVHSTHGIAITQLLLNTGVTNATQIHIVSWVYLIGSPCSPCPPVESPGDRLHDFL